MNGRPNASSQYEDAIKLPNVYRMPTPEEWLAEIHLLTHQRDTFKYANEAFAKQSASISTERQSERDGWELEKKYLAERLQDQHKKATEGMEERIAELIWEKLRKD